MAWVLDLDGVLWLADQPIDGAVEAVHRLREAGEQVVFVTNFSFETVAVQEAKLAAFGVPATGAVISSATAVARLVEPGERVLVIGGPGVIEALEERGAVAVVPLPGTDVGIDAVVVGLDPAFSYDKLAAATVAIRGGARFVATNGDLTYPTPNGLVPGAGSLVAAIAAASGRDADVAGKPHAAMASLVRDRLGATGTVVGDRPDTDGAFARVLGYRFALVLSGVTTEADLPVDPEPDDIAPDLATLVARMPA